MRRSYAPLCALFFGVNLPSCGSRTGLVPGEEEPVTPSCETSADCDDDDLCNVERCVAGSCQVVYTKECPNSDPCSSAHCESSSGACITTPLTRDDDGDGFRAPLPGFRPGAPGACGDDCDDTRATAFPGGVEICDGVDNDCDGVVDNGSLFLSAEALPEPPTPIKVAGPSFDRSGRRGMAFGGGTFGLNYWGHDGVSQGYLSGVTATGAQAFAERRVSSVNTASFGHTMIWSGTAFAVAWSDARVDDNYEIFFTRFAVGGEKLGPDLRVTDALRFSLHPQLIFDQGRYVVVFDDHRQRSSGGPVQVYGQLIDVEGELLGAAVVLSSAGLYAEYPSLAATATRYGLVYTANASPTEPTALEFRSFDKAFEQPSAPLRLAENDVRGPSVIALGDVFVVTWDRYENGVGPLDSIMGAVVSDTGQLLIGPVAIASGADKARSHSVVSLGDRALFAWSDDLEGRFEIYAKVLGSDLGDIEPRRRLTDDDPAESVFPLLSLSDQGRIGLLFDDLRSGEPHAYFASFGCAAR